MADKQAQAQAQREPGSDVRSLARHHLVFGWWVLAIFLAQGLVLESLHAFKTDFYLNVANQTRRFMWTLAHAHGSLLGLLNLAFGFTARELQGWAAGRRQVASRALIAATLLVPGGFFLGGLWVHSGDPGLGVLLVPPGAVLAIVAAAMTAIAVGRHHGGGGGSPPPTR